MMVNRLAIVIAVDGLRASALGTYGNTSFLTPSMDDLASRSLVVEWLLANSPSLNDFCHNSWSTLPATGYRKWLFTDAAEVGAFSGDSFHEVFHFEAGPAQAAEQIEKTHTAKFLTHAVEQLALWHKDAEKHGTSSLLWIHFSGLCGPWDAPLELRSELMEEDDLEAPDFVVPPTSVAIGDDPDELLGYRASYAAQVAVLDSCMAGFIEAVDSFSPDVEKLVMIIGTRGFSLGEHGCVGYDCGTLYSEQIHLPWLILNTETRRPLPRVAGFAQATDIGITLGDWLLTDNRRGEATGYSLIPHFTGECFSVRDVALSFNMAGELAIRTPGWMMKKGDNIELYAKPDDRWEANNVATRCPEIVELLGQCMQSSDAHFRRLPAELLSLWK